jgi:hypothetical protein
MAMVMKKGNLNVNVNVNVNAKENVNNLLVFS